MTADQPAGEFAPPELGSRIGRLFDGRRKGFPPLLQLVGYHRREFASSTPIVSHTSGKDGLDD